MYVCMYVCINNILKILCYAVVAGLRDSETIIVSENMDIADSSTAQLCIPTIRSNAATQAPTTKIQSVSVSVHMKGRDKGKRLPHKYNNTMYIMMIEIQTSTTKKQNSVATPCNLLNAPPLEIFPQASAFIQ